jgi:hypothetical protein
VPFDVLRANGTQYTMTVAVHAEPVEASEELATEVHVPRVFSVNSSSTDSDRPSIPCWSANLIKFATSL